MHERPLQNPEFVNRSEEGFAYQIEKDDQREQLPRLVRLPDISVYSEPILLKPGESATTYGTVPKDYFPPFIPEPEIPYYLRYLLYRRYYSVKSKIAQAGLVAYPRFSVNTSFLDFPIAYPPDGSQGYAFEMLLTNDNPVNTYRLPENMLPLMRFYIPNKPMRGFELVQSAKNMDSHKLRVHDDQGNFYNLADLACLPDDDPFYLTDPYKEPSGILVNIDRDVPQDFSERIVDLQTVLRLPHTARAEVDQLLGLQKHCQNEDDFKRGIPICQTTPFKLPHNRALLIDPRTFDPSDTTLEIPRHVPSTLIDPNFGQPDGLPIRLERRMALPSSNYDRFIPVTCHVA